MIYSQNLDKILLYLTQRYLVRIMKKEKHSQRRNKKPFKEYNSPTLKKFGSILSMTSGGSAGPAPDGTSGMFMT